MNTYDWYSQLLKPEWAPPSWLFGPVWSVLYTVIAISFGTVFYHVFTKRLSWKVGLPFALNIVCNLAFTPLQFGLKNNLLAAIDITLVLSTLVWALLVLWRTTPSLRWITYSNIPYLAWVFFATSLQFTITFLNT